ncbi:aspartate kinase [Fragilaria crotonensis]|nr:aspartate kinase [Fragilaria crotonensis]
MRVLLLAIVALGNARYCDAFVVHPHAATAAANPVSAQTQSSALFMADEAKKNVKEYKSALSQIRTNGTNGASASNKPMDVVMKFGGSSLANYERIDHVANLIKDQIKAGYRPRAVVCSAMGKTTNNLLNAGNNALDGSVDIDAIRTLHTATIDEFQMPAHTSDEVNALLRECEDMLNGVRLIQELSPKSLDQLVSYGERCSVRVMAARLNQLGVPAQAFDAWDMGIMTNSNFGDAQLLVEHEDAVRKAFARLDPNVVAVVTGFIGHDPNGKITTLGRGGSDLTATALGAAIQLDEIQVWKDVDGILSSDPRLVPNAIPVNHVTYEEASELAYFGAQVLHPIAMQPALKYNVPVRVKNSYNASAEGTVITATYEGFEKRLVTAITYKRDVKLMDIQCTAMLGAYGFLAKVFGDFEKRKIGVDVLASSEVSVSLTLDKKQDSDAINLLVSDLQPYADVTLKDKRSILTLITDVERSSEVLATVFRVFNSQGIKVEMMSQGASKVNISFILSDDQLEKAVLNLHKCFFEDRCIITPEGSAKNLSMLLEPMA